MFLNKILSNSRLLLSKNALPFKSPGVALRQRHVFATPPQTPLSTAEHFAYGTLLFVSVWFIPLWITYYLPDYQREPRDEYVGK